MRVPAMFTSPHSVVASFMRAALQARGVSAQASISSWFALSLCHPAASRRHTLHTLHTLRELAPDADLPYMAASAMSQRSWMRCTHSAVESTCRAGGTEHVRWTARVEHMC